jgi:hypothetical protein
MGKRGFTANEARLGLDRIHVYCWRRKDFNTRNYFTIDKTTIVHDASLLCSTTQNSLFLPLKEIGSRIVLGMARY